MHNNIKRQQGGTILGLIIGLVIGLGIALAVAVAVTKTPIPFTDKSGRHKGGEPRGGEFSDPNKSLYRNNGAAKDYLRTPSELPESAVVPKPAEKKPETRVEARPDSKPKKVEVAADANGAGTDGGDDKWSYYLQAGAFREQPDAESMRAKLALQGIEARISERQSESGMLYRVRVGPFGDLDTMNKVRRKLSDNGVDAAIVRIAKQ